MITTQNETIARPAQDRLHAATIGFNARGARIVKASSMNRTPEVRVELEISSAPLAPHRAKKRLEMLLDLWVCAVQHIPWAMTPAAKRHAVGSQRVALTVCYKPIRMLLEDMRLFFRDERRHPDGWFK